MIRMKVLGITAGLVLAIGVAASAQNKIGYINSNDLALSMPEMITANKTLEDFQKQKETVLQTMEDERQKKIALYQDKYKNLSEANRSVLEKELVALEKEITDIMQRINETAEKSQQEVSERQESLFAPIILKATNAIKSVAKEKGYGHVFDTSQPGLVYFDEGDDLLQMVQTKLGISKTAGN